MAVAMALSAFQWGSLTETRLTAHHESAHCTLQVQWSQSISTNEWEAAQEENYSVYANCKMKIVDPPAERMQGGTQKAPWKNMRNLIHHTKEGVTQKPF